MPRASLNHIGIAVSTAADAPGVLALKRLFSLMGLATGEVETVADQGVRVHFVHLPADSGHLELLEPTDPEGTIAKFVAKRGPGIHHLSFRLDAGELDPFCDQLRAFGYRLIYDDAKAGAHRMRVNFIHPSSAGGVLIELMEPSDP